MTRRLRALAAALLAAAAIVSVQPASASSPVAPTAATTDSGAAPQGTALAYLQARYPSLDGNWNNYSIATRLLTDLKRAGAQGFRAQYVNRLWSAGVPASTFLVPNDRAFQLLLQQRIGRTFTTEKALLRQLELMVADDVDILLGHGVLPTRLTQRQIIGLNGRNLASVWTPAWGYRIHVAVYHFNSGTAVSLWDKDFGLRNPRLVLSQGNLNASSRQIVHGIDRILWGFPVRMSNDGTWFAGGPDSLVWQLSPCENPPDNPFYCTGLPEGAPGHGG